MSVQLPTSVQAHQWSYSRLSNSLSSGIAVTASLFFIFIWRGKLFILIIMRFYWPRFGCRNRKNSSIAWWKVFVIRKVCAVECKIIIKYRFFKQVSVKFLDTSESFWGVVSVCRPESFCASKVSYLDVFAFSVSVWVVHCTACTPLLVRGPRLLWQQLVPGDLIGDQLTGPQFIHWSKVAHPRDGTAEK